MVNWNRTIVPNSVKTDTFALYEPIIGKIFLESVFFPYPTIFGYLWNDEEYFLLFYGCIGKLLSLVIID